MMRRIGFAPWTPGNEFPRIDDPTQDDETFHQQAARVVAALGEYDIEEM